MDHEWKGIIRGVLLKLGRMKRKRTCFDRKSQKVNLDPFFRNHSSLFLLYSKSCCIHFSPKQLPAFQLFFVREVNRSKGTHQNIPPPPFSIPSRSSVSQSEGSEQQEREHRSDSVSKKGSKASRSTIDSDNSLLPSFASPASLQHT